MSELIYKDESYKIVGLCMSIHNELGKGFLEAVYKDALELELKKNGIPFEREKAYEIDYKGNILSHKFFADFVVYDKIILEIKATAGLIDNNLKQTLNYLAVSRIRLALLINFGEDSLKYKRIIL